VARRYVSINKAQYSKIKELINNGHSYIAWVPKKFNTIEGHSNYVYDRININLDGFNFKQIDINAPVDFVKSINREFRCFIVPTGFPSPDPALSLRHLKLTITGVS